MNALDVYNVRSRLVPAIMACGSLIFLGCVLLPSSAYPMVKFASTVLSLLVVFALADIARRNGKRVEEKLFSSVDGKPKHSLLSYKNDRIDATTKVRYMNWLANQLGEEAIDFAFENAHPDKADAFYQRCGTWLREQTRDKDKFNILFEENKTYGFRRNLYGLRHAALALDFLISAAATIVLTTESLNWLESLGGTYILLSVIVVCALHAAYFLIYVTKKSVKDASELYERQLLLSIEQLMS